MPYTRAMVSAALNGDLDEVAFETDPFFGLSIPIQCPDVPSKILFPRKTWLDKEAYDQAAVHLVGSFEENFGQYINEMPEEIVIAGPSLERLS